MANQIRLKRGSGSDPSASDLATGEIAVRTDNGKLFTKKDDGSVAEISGGGGVSDGDKGDITVSNNGATFTIDSGVIDNANVASSAAIHGSKINPNFGSQTIQGGTLEISQDSSGTPEIKFDGTGPNYIRFVDSQDSSHNLDLIFRSTPNTLAVEKSSDATVLFSVDNDDGQVIVSNNLDVGAGLDVTGSITATGDVVINNSEPKLKLTDSDNNSDFILLNSHGNFRIFDETNSAERFKIDSSGTGTFSGNLNISSGGDIDVAGNIIVGGTVDGRDVATDGTKLDTVETNAKDDQTAAEIKTLLNSNQLETAQIANNAITADKISNSTVTFSKLQNVSQNRIVGRVSSGSGVLQELTAANIRSIINVEDGATGDQTASDIRSLGFFDTNNDGAGSGLDADLLDGLHGSQYLRSDANDDATGDITFNGTASFNSGAAGAATIQGNGDIRFNNGNWTGNACKIQHHSNYLYIQSGSSGHVFRHSSGDNRWLIDDNGHFVPGTDSTFNIGTNGNRVANGYFDTLYGDGSNLTGISAGLPTTGGTLTGTLNSRHIIPTANNTYDLGSSSNRWANLYTNDLNLSNEGGKNAVDGTWGDWTIQEGEDKVFMLNNRNGKKYAINLTEIV